MNGSANAEVPRITVRENRAKVADSDLGSKSADWRQSKWLALGELLVVILIFLADARHLVPFSKTPFLLALGWISLSVQRVGWRG